MDNITINTTTGELVGQDLALSSDPQECVFLYRQIGEAADSMRGAILKHVRDNKIYKRDYTTFEAFAEAELGISRKEAYRLISDYEVRLNVSDSTQRPTSISQTEQLAKLPASEQADAWEEVVTDAEESGEKITAKKVEQVVAKRRGDAWEKSDLNVFKVSVQVNLQDADWTAARIVSAGGRQFALQLASSIERLSQ